MIKHKQYFLRTILFSLGLFFYFESAAQWQYDIKTDLLRPPSLSFEVTTPKRLALELGYAYFFFHEDVFANGPAPTFVQGKRLFPRHRWEGFLSLHYYALWFKQNHGMAVGLRTRVNRPAYTSPQLHQAYQLLRGRPFRDVRFFVISTPVTYKFVLIKRFVLEIVIDYSFQWAKDEGPRQQARTSDFWNFSVNLGYRLTGKSKTENRTLPLELN